VRKILLIIISIIILDSLIYPIITRKPVVHCANDKSCTESQKLKVENNTVGIFNSRQVVPPKIILSLKDTKPSILGVQTSSEEKHIYVDLSKQTLYAYQGKKLFMQTYISSGKWFPTPTGDFTIWTKLRATRMSGGQGADYYDLPNVPYVMFFENKDVPRSVGFSLHGAYWHNNFGHAMSHGCVNMRIIDAQKLYDWVNPLTKGYTTYASDKNQGTKITIYGQAPI
jgi:lipoprotein-anchoring transpeptidase ErfK/SrfK